MNHVQYHVSWFVLRTESSKALNADGDFSKSPVFNFNDDKLKFNTNDVSNANENYGCVLDLKKSEDFIFCHCLIKHLFDKVTLKV